MPEIPYGGVTGNDATDDHLWPHGVDFEGAQEVWMGPAKYFAQPARARPGELDPERLQPERIKMVGPDLRGRLLTFILELPAEDLRSQVVTGWISTPSEQSRYDQPGGRMRTR